MKLLKFEADWCNTCKAQDRELSKLKGIDVQHVDVEEDESEVLMQKYKVRGLPTMVIIDDKGNDLHKFSSLTKAEELQQTWDSLIKMNLQ